MKADLRNRLERACAGLYYVSEIDAPFAIVDVMPSVDEATETRPFDAFFAPMIAIHPGYQERQMTRAKRSLELKSLLEGSLTGLAVYKFGSGVTKTIYIVGRDQQGKLLGLRTEAVET